MTNANRSIGLMAGCVVLIGAAHVVAQDWPQWRGSDRDGRVAEFAAPETWPGALVEKWKTTVGLGNATPALVGDKLYVFARQGEDEVTLCLNAGDGKELWRDKFTAQAVTGAASLAPQYNTPVLADGLLFGLSDRGKLFCINAETGQTAQTDETSLDRKGFGAIVHAGSTLLALSSNSELVAFAPSDKQFTELARIKVADTATYAHPVITGNRIFVKNQDTVTMWTIE
jgi:outer membrane protein assembly factor BamB